MAITRRMKRRWAFLGDTSSMVGCNLPEDIIFQILLRLPVKSLVRFKAVCKNWCALIKTSHFVQKHQKTRPGLNPDHVFSAIIAPVRPNTPYIDVFRLYLSDSLDKPVDIDLPFSMVPYRYRVLGTCDGLFCILLRKFSSDIVIFNPITREFRLIPTFKISVKRKVLVFWGFGLLNNSYGLARIVYNSLPNGELIVRAELYSLSTNSWREIYVKMGEVNILDHLRRTYSEGIPIFLRGNFYWASPDWNQKRVVCFDISKEAFFEIVIPFAITFNWKLENFKEQLAVVTNLGRQQFKVWVFDENQRTWTNKHTIRHFPESLVPLDSYLEIILMGCGGKGELVFKIHYGDKIELLLCDPVSQKMKRLPYADVEGNNFLYLYSESLVSVFRCDEVAEADLGLLNKTRQRKSKT